MFYRSLLLFSAGMMATFGSDVVHLPGAGPLGCLTLAFVAAFRWRKEREDGQPVRMPVPLIYHTKLKDLDFQSLSNSFKVLHTVVLLIIVDINLRAISINFQKM